MCKARKLECGLKEELQSSNAAQKFEGSLLITVVEKGCINVKMFHNQLKIYFEKFTQLGCV